MPFAPPTTSIFSSSFVKPTAKYFKPKTCLLSTTTISFLSKRDNNASAFCVERLNFSNSKIAFFVAMILIARTPAFSSASAPVSGVIVVAEGAGNVRVELELLEAVHALLGVDSERIEILAMKEVDP